MMVSILQSQRRTLNQPNQKHGCPRHESYSIVFYRTSRTQDLSRHQLVAFPTRRFRDLSQASLHRRFDGPDRAWRPDRVICSTFTSAPQSTSLGDCECREMQSTRMYEDDTGHWARPNSVSRRSLGCFCPCSGPCSGPCSWPCSS